MTDLEVFLGVENDHEYKSSKTGFISSYLSSARSYRVFNKNNLASSTNSTLWW
jgi:hypothetical protein